MTYLNILFEKDVKAEIIDGKISFFGRIYEYLELVQPNTPLYEDVYKQWAAFWKSQRLDRFNQLLEIYDNRSRMENLIDVIKNEEVIPFVGAGMSLPSGFPLWGSFLARVHDMTNIPKEDFGALLDNFDYEKAADLLINEIGHAAFNQKVESRFSLNGNTQIVGNILHLPRIFKGNYITTNFDNILEEIVKEQNGGFERVILGRDAHNFVSLSQKLNSLLFKIHGDCDLPDTRVLLGAEYEAAYADPKYIGAMKNIFQNHTMLFIGCSLVKDRYLDLMEIIVDSSQKVPYHYAFLSRLDIKDNDETNSALKKRDIELGKKSIFPIWFDDYNQDIEALLVGIMDGIGVI